jgi:hypothetical protein
LRPLPLSQEVLAELNDYVQSILLAKKVDDAVDPIFITLPSALEEFSGDSIRY